MSTNQNNPEDIENFVVYRLPSLNKKTKGKLKSFGFVWDMLHHGWIGLASKAEDVETVLQKTGLDWVRQDLSLPRNLVITDPKIANRKTKLEIMERQLYKDEEQLLIDIHAYDSSLMPYDFSEAPLQEGKTDIQIQIEADFYERRTSLQQLREQIESIRKELNHLSLDVLDKGKVFDPDAPVVIAEALIQEHFLFQDERTLHYCSDVFWHWDETKYIEMYGIRMRQIIYDFLRDAKKLDSEGHLVDFNPVKMKVDQIVDAFQAICYKGYCPANGAVWLDARQEPDPKYLISFNNGLLDLQRWLIDPATKLMAHTPLLLNTNALCFDFNPQVAEPKEWCDFLNTIWPDDPDSQQTLQEWMGYVLTQDTRLHKILLMIGPPRSGKGTIGRIMHALLGAFNVVGPTLSSLGGEFGLQPWLNKMLATISDARLNSRNNNSVIIERLLSISGEDPLTINRKFLSALTVQLPTRIMIMSNELPDMRDASGALANRYIVLALQKSWLGKEDITLFSRLRAELPNILIWALHGLALLQQRGKFLQPASAAPTIAELETITSPIKAFVSEKCDIGQCKMITAAALFKAWQCWCEDTGYPHSGNIQSFGKNLKAAYPDIQIVRPQSSNSRERVYMGIALVENDASSATVRGHNEDLS
jgi:putative DNA primase/helicase